MQWWVSLLLLEQLPQTGLTPSHPFRCRMQRWQRSPVAVDLEEPFLGFWKGGRSSPGSSSSPAVFLAAEEVNLVFWEAFQIRLVSQSEADLEEHQPLSKAHCHSVKDLPVRLPESARPACLEQEKSRARSLRLVCARLRLEEVVG